MQIQLSGENILPLAQQAIKSTRLSVSLFWQVHQGRSLSSLLPSTSSRNRLIESQSIYDRKMLKIIRFLLYRLFFSFLSYFLSFFSFISSFSLFFLSSYSTYYISNGMLGPGNLIRSKQYDYLQSLQSIQAFREVARQSQHCALGEDWFVY